MIRILKTITVAILCVALVTGSLVFTEAKITIPSETDPFVSNYYVGATDQSAPFFDVVLPEIAKNIKTNNKHSISPYYDKFPPANNPENFQGLGSTTYANINGKKVTAEAFYRVHNESLSDPNNGMGLLIYQCIQYKRKHPNEDVKITFSSYRTSVTAAVCVLPESKYYGYMRSLYGTNYDEHGFVRISYMLTEAARMGIEVTMVNQLNSYAVKQYNPATGKTASRKNLSLNSYFTKALDTKCYDSYAKGKKVSDFMDYCMVGWTVGDKTHDMQHVKSATVSHYLATDGKEHGKSVFFETANLDENNYIGANGNNGSQSGVIVSDHDELYRITYNYTRLMYDYRGQEEMYELRKVVYDRNVEQFALINSGREDEIPSNEQILYLGSDKDPVFKLYFTPFAGAEDAWEPDYNPICYHVDKLANSDDYVELMWNVYSYSNCYLGDAMSDKFEKAFCENANVKNKYSVYVTNFDSDAISKLTLGKDIGYRSINSGDGIHSKDFLMSYSDNGVRHRVSLMTSCNYGHSAFYYRTNSMLVIDETDKTGGNFYNILGEKYSYGMIDNDLMVTPANLQLEVGKTYKPEVKYSGKKTLTYKSSDTSVATVSEGKITAVKEGSATITISDGTHKTTLKLTVVKSTSSGTYGRGLTFNLDEQYVLSKKLSSKPSSFETSFSINKDSLKSTATLFGSDGNFDPAITYYINASGNPCVGIRATAGYGNIKKYTFNKVNVATGKKVHLAITTDYTNKKMYCYVDGQLAQTITGIVSVPSTFKEKHAPVVGGDHLNGNATYFTGTIYSVAVWSDIRSASEISADYSKGITKSDSKLMVAYDFSLSDKERVKDLSSNANNLKCDVLWQNNADVPEVTDYEYSFAVIGDTQTMCENDPEAMESIYDWILENKEEQKIEYVIGLGDITDDSTDREWEDAKRYISKLDGNIPYALARGNHDALDDFNNSFNNGVYDNTVNGVMTEGDLTNSYRYFNIQGTDYLIMTIDFAPSTAVLEWANSVIEQHPHHKVIIVTHAYMYRDGTTLDAGDCYPPTYYKAYTDAQNGDDMWKKSFSKHENVLMVLSGHDPWQHIVYRQDEGVYGNTVTQMLIDAQYVDRYIGSTAMVAMFFFSDDGNTLTVRYYSVEKDCYGSAQSQFTVDLEGGAHTCKTVVVDATLSKDGEKITQCTNCDEVVSKTPIYKPADFKLSATSYTYNGKVKTPSVTVKDSKGNTLKQDTDFLVSYESGRKNPGRYTVTVSMIGNYSGTKKLVFTIKPKVTSKISATQTTSTITLSWDKVTGVSGYRVYQLDSKTGKYKHIASVTKGTSYKASKLSAGTTYKFKIRAYKKDDGTIWGDYSSEFATATKTKTPTLKVSASSAKGKVNAKWSNVSGETGFQLFYSAKSSGGFKKVKTYSKNVLEGSKTGLTSGKTYYFKVRAYKKVDGKYIYSSFSSVKNVKVK